MSEYFDKYAEHIIDTEFYAQEKEAEFVKFMNKLKKGVLGIMDEYPSVSSKVEANKLYRELEDYVDDEIDYYIEDLKRDREKQADKESDFLSTLLDVMLGINIALSILNRKNALEFPFSKNNTVDTMADNLKENVKRSVRVPLITTRILGSSTSTMKESVSSQIDSIAKKSKSDIHTSVTALQRNLLLLSMSTAKVKYEYISMLDEKTCGVCASYSGTLYDTLEEAPVLPIHNNCRCYILPVHTYEEQPSYEDWLKRQPDSVVYKILGPSRYALYKSGVSIKKFTSEGRYLTLEELFKDISKK